MFDDDQYWPNSEFPCHPQHRAEQEILDPIHERRQYGAKCPTCGLGYRICPRVFDHPLTTVSVLEWSLAYPSGETLVLPPVAANLMRANAPLYPDVPWPSGWPQDPRRRDNKNRWLQAVSIEDVRRDGFAATLKRLRAEARWVDTKGASSLVVLTEPVVVHGVTVADTGEVLLARRGWVRMRPDRVVLAHSRWVDHYVVVSRNFAFIPRPLDDLAIAPPPSNEPLGLFDTAPDRP